MDIPGEILEYLLTEYITCLEDIIDVCRVCKAWAKFKELRWTITGSRDKVIVLPFKFLSVYPNITMIRKIFLVMTYDDYRQEFFKGFPKQKLSRAKILTVNDSIDANGLHTINYMFSSCRSFKLFNVSIDPKVIILTNVVKELRRCLSVEEEDDLFVMKRKKTPEGIELFYGRGYFDDLRDLSSLCPHPDIKKDISLTGHISNSILGPALPNEPIKAVSVLIPSTSVEEMQMIDDTESINFVYYNCWRDVNEDREPSISKIDGKHNSFSKIDGKHNYLLDSERGRIEVLNGFLIGFLGAGMPQPSKFLKRFKGYIIKNDRIYDGLGWVTMERIADYSESILKILEKHGQLANIKRLDILMSRGQAVLYSKKGLSLDKYHIYTWEGGSWGVDKGSLPEALKDEKKINFYKDSSDEIKEKM